MMSKKVKKILYVHMPLIRAQFEQTSLGCTFFVTFFFPFGASNLPTGAKGGTSSSCARGGVKAYSTRLGRITPTRV